jgi:hypothetical protein
MRELLHADTDIAVQMLPLGHSPRGILPAQTLFLPAPYISQRSNLAFLEVLVNAPAVAMSVPTIPADVQSFAAEKDDVLHDVTWRP